MRDVADIANEHVEAMTQAALTHRKPVLPKIGSCYNCEAPVPGIYCDEECREDHEKRVRAELHRKR
jgi:hypothetical protein